MEKKVTKKITVKKSTQPKEKKVVSNELNLNPKVWGVEMNVDLVAQVLNVQLSNARQENAHAKSRADVSGGGRKPWKQKGTGRARHGSTRSPIWVGGGVTFVPNERVWKQKVNKKMVVKAISMLLTDRLKNDNIIFANIAKEDTKQIRANLVSQLPAKSSLVVASSDIVKNSISNVKSISYINAKELSVIHLAKARKLVIDQEVVKMIEDRLTNEK